MTSCIKSSVSKNHDKNKVSQKTSVHLPELFKNENITQKPELRCTNIIENRLQGKESWIERIQQVMDLTCRSEDEVVMAIHDCDEDLNRAVNALLEGVSSEWEVKKKKARQSATSKATVEQPQVVNKNTHWDDIPRSQNDRSSSGRGRVSHINRKWKKRENKENEKNTDDYNLGTLSRSKKLPGRLRGGRGGGRLGSRSISNIEESISNQSSSSFNRPIETWSSEVLPNCPQETKKGCWNPSEVSEDWENEEYTGSLADTKVFTPSSHVRELNHSTQKMNINDCESIETFKFSGLLSQNNRKQVKPRRRIPPPSKIPSSAVEMPGDSLSNSINFLDVQFGALEFGCESNLNDSLNQAKFISCKSQVEVPALESNTLLKTIPTSINSLDSESKNTISAYTYSKIPEDGTNSLTEEPQISKDNQPHSQTGFKCVKITQVHDFSKTDRKSSSSLSASSTFDSNLNFQSSKPIYATPEKSSSYSSFTCETQSSPSTYSCATINRNNDSFPVMVSVTQAAGYKSSYSQPSMVSFNSTSTLTDSNETFIKTSPNQVYSTNSGITSTSESQFTSSSSSTNVCYANLPYTNAEYQCATTFSPSLPAYQSSSTSFSVMSQGQHVYSNNSQSVYENTYQNYDAKNQVLTPNHKLNSNKSMQYENIPTTCSLNSGSVASLDLPSTSGHLTQNKATVPTGASKNTTTVTATTVTSTTSATPTTSTTSSTSTSNLSSLTGSTNGNIAPILGHQYIMGQSVPYATFQQPHMYSYEDLQMMQQRMSHLPSTGYYDATLGYQSSAPVTSLGSSRNDTLSNVQSVQSVQAVQGQFNNLSDSRFSRTDNTSPVSSNISQQTSTQHSQPLLNPIPPGYAYFYGGSILPASGFQYGAPTLYPPIPPTNNSNSSNVSFSKPSNYSSGYNTGSSYDMLTNAGGSNDYKNSATGYANSPMTKNNQSNGNTSVGNTNDVNNVVYTKNHVTVSKTNTYDKQNFHTGSTPQFGLTNNQNASVISGYGAPHLYIPTVPHQLHQPLHQDTANTSGQRTNSNLQNKPQTKSGYTGSYWTGSN